MDFDVIKKHNLDRLNYAVTRDVGRKKVAALAEYLQACATAENFRVETVDAPVYEEEGYRAALDCDLLFSCVGPALGTIRS